MLTLVLSASLASLDVTAFSALMALDAGVPPAPAPALAPAPPAEPQGEFIKGELSTSLGSDRLTVKNTRVGVSAGLDRFGEAFYVLLEPLVDLRFLDGKLGIGVGVPLRFELFNFAGDPATGDIVGFQNLFHLRTQDWDSVHDYGRVLKYVTYGKKEDRVFISAGQRYSSSIGHGAIQRRYAPNIDIDYPRVSVEVDLYNDYAGFELMTNDLLEDNQLSGLVFLKPFSFFDPESLVLKTLSIGVSGGLDWKAPWQLQLDPVTGLRLLDGDGRMRATTSAVKLVGVDLELKVVKTDAVDLKPYLDYSMLLGGDAGLTVGVLGRFNVGAQVVHAFRVVLEGRYLGNHYAPGYFDTFYEVDRFAYLNRDLRAPGDPFAVYTPKYRYLMETGLGTRFGYYGEFSWGIPGAIGVTLALEGVSSSPAVNALAHLEVPLLSFVQIFASYYLRGVTSFAELGYDPARHQLGLFGDKAIAFAGARLKVLPFLFLNGRLYKTFRMNPDRQRYDNQFGFVVDLELGWEFARAEPTPAAAQGQTAASTVFEPRG